MFFDRPGAHHLLGVFLFTLVVTFCARELVPGKGFGLRRQSGELYALAAVSGAVTGFCSARHRCLGALAGGVAALGAVQAVVQTFLRAPQADSHAQFLALLFGAVPGLWCYCLLESIVHRVRRMTKPSEEKVAE